MINVRQSSSSRKTSKDDIYAEHSPLILLNEISRIELDRIAGNTEFQYGFNESARLVFIKLADNEGCTQHDIVGMTHMKKPTVSVIVSRFEDQGLVTKTLDEIDHRASRLYLTDAGRSEVAKLRRFFAEEEKIAVDGLSLNEYDTLVKLLSKIRYNLAEAGK